MADFPGKRFSCVDSLFCGSKVRSREDHLYFQAAEKRRGKIAIDSEWPIYERISAEKWKDKEE